MISLKSDTYDIEGHEYEKQRNFKECGRSMLAAAESLPDHPKHAERLWNAGQCFQNAHLVGQALKARQRARSRTHPKDPLAQKALFRVAAGYHQLAYYSRRPRTTRTSPASSRARGRRPTPWATPRRSASACGECDKAIADMDVVREVLRRAQAAGCRGRLLPDGRGLREGEEVRRARPPPGELPQEVGHARAPTEQVLAHFRLGEMPGRRPAPGGRQDGACLGDQARGRHRPPEGHLRAQQEDDRQEEEDQGEGADPVRPAHQVEDHRVRPEPATSRPPPRSTSRRPPAVRQAAAAAQQDHRQGRAAGPGGAGHLRRGGRGLLPGREDLRGLPAHQVPRGPRVPAAQQYDSKRKAAAKKKGSRKTARSSPRTSPRRAKLAVKLAGPAPTRRGSTTRSSTTSRRTGPSPARPASARSRPTSSASCTPPRSPRS